MPCTARNDTLADCPSGCVRYPNTASLRSIALVPRGSLAANWQVREAQCTSGGLISQRLQVEIGWTLYECVTGSGEKAMGLRHCVRNWDGDFAVQVLLRGSGSNAAVSDRGSQCAPTVQNVVRAVF